MNTKTALAIVIAIIVVFGAALLFMGGSSAPIALPETEQGAPLTPYTNDTFGLSFQYPSTLFLYERSDIGTPNSPQLAVLLVEDTQENRDVLEGRATTPREGPTGITITVMDNPDELAALEWVKNDTNWTVATSSATPVSVSGIEGVLYTWSGLYEGKSVVVTKGDKAYVFSVTWMTAEDQILKDFDTVLNSIVL